MGFFKASKKNIPNSKFDNTENNPNKSESPNLHSHLNDNITEITDGLGNCSDISIRNIDSDTYRLAVIYISGLVDKSSLNSLSEELNKYTSPDYQVKSNSKNYFELLKSALLSTRSIKIGLTFDSIFEALLSGNTIVLVEGSKEYIAINTYETEGRSVEEPTSQTVIRGPKEGFTEKIGTNISLIRRRIKNKSVRVQDINLGSVTNTRVSIMYLEKIAKDEIVKEIKRRLSLIKIDSILDSHYIEELIKDNRYSIFPTVLNSEKADAVASALLEGRVAILVDGSAYVLTAPALFVEFVQSSEDYYHHFIVSSMIRFIRFLALALTLLVPSTYVALVTFHQEILPTPLLISLAAQREGVPFPALVEAFLMELTFEILREAGIRMPSAIGPAISIVGALVIGQAAVEAGIVSAAMVIIVSITAISSFAIPNYSMSNAIRMVRFGLMLLAGSFGLYGVYMGLIFLLLHLCNLKTIGIPYLTPIAPKVKYGYRDTLIRGPLWSRSANSGGLRGTKAPRINTESIMDIPQKEKPEGNIN